jgi:uncharacterized protein YdhG (YjbR/CyaY superfamily)
VYLTILKDLAQWQALPGLRGEFSIMRANHVPTSIPEYISACPPPVQAILERIRQTVRTAVPEAQETISYRMPAFRLGGILLYFAAFKSHIGVYPPVSGDPSLERALSAFEGPKGNLKFPIHQPIPYDLIARIVTLRAKQQATKASARRAKPALLTPARARSSVPGTRITRSRIPIEGKG